MHNVIIVTITNAITILNHVNLFLLVESICVDFKKLWIKKQRMKHLWRTEEGRKFTERDDEVVEDVTHLVMGRDQCTFPVGIEVTLLH